MHFSLSYQKKQRSSGPVDFWHPQAQLDLALIYFFIIYLNEWNSIKVINALQNRAWKQQKFSISCTQRDPPIKVYRRHLWDIATEFIFYWVLWQDCALLGTLDCLNMRHLWICSAKIAKSRRMYMYMTASCMYVLILELTCIPGTGGIHLQFCT